MTTTEEPWWYCPDCGDPFTESGCYPGKCNAPDEGDPRAVMTKERDERGQFIWRVPARAANNPTDPITQDRSA